ncbi:YbaK/EbsC family protein [Streptomyces sp. NPDC032161]|uniref:YbaK/EbsC family protein n=1 Tax=unclassified Streptomyces TaxID=2593676 RepID=UPI0033FD151F
MAALAWGGGESCLGELVEVAGDHGGGQAEYTVHEHAAAHSVAERQALPFPWSQAVKTLAFTAPDIPLLLVALRAEDRVDFARLAAVIGASRSRPRTADAGLLAAEGLVPGGVPPVSHRPGVPCLIDTAVAEPDRTVHCGAGAADRTLRIGSAALARLPRAQVASLSR